MNSTLILLPSFAMFALTMSCIFAMGFARYRAIKQREIRISYFRTYNEGSQPERLHLLSRHVQNHFEVPPLFHLGVIVAYVSGSVTMAASVFAWLFVAARVLHTYIHLGSNNVSRRFFVFGFSLLSLCALWVSVALTVLLQTV
ncbi:MAG: MAPEG family protein [Oceanococcus sp.]